jgi:hypothetical protein
LSANVAFEIWWPDMFVIMKLTDKLRCGWVIHQPEYTFQTPTIVERLVPYENNATPKEVNPLAIHPGV